jgi:Putative zinc-finger
MSLLTCAAVRRRIAAFHDRELAIGEMIAIETHIQDCPPCARELRELRHVGDALRAAAAPAPSDDWTGLQSDVISRMRAEAHESLTARARRLFEDMHLVWIGLASTAATFLCGGIVLSMLQFASPERGDSLAAVIAVMSAPLGSDQNPARLDRFLSVPSTVPGDDIIPATFAGSSSKDEVVLPLSVIVTREGRVQGVSVLSNDHDDRDFTDVLDAISRAKLQPAQGGGGPVAVSLVWLLAHTTVKGKISS